MANPVFLIPEILSEILEQVDCVEQEPFWRPRMYKRKPRSLLRCQLVNSLWFNEASRIIWRVLYRFRHLREVEDAHRRQQYVEMVRDFTLEGAQYKPGPFEFTRLKAVRIWQSSNLDDVHLLLMPTVEHLQFSSHAKFNGLETLDRRCPNMKSLILQLETKLTRELVKCLKRYLAVTTARRVVLQAYFEYTEKLLPALAQNDNVRELVNVRISQDAILNVIQSGIKQPFKHLNYFSSIGGGVEMRDLLCIMPNVEYLIIDKMNYYRQSRHATYLTVVLEHASANLKMISMSTGRYKVDNSRLLALAKKFPLLELVRLYRDTCWRNDSNQDASEMLNNEFAHEVTRRLPKLKVIELEFDHESLTAEGLVSIAKNCPLLRVLNLMSHNGYPGRRKRSLLYYPTFSAEKEPLFPRLIYFQPLEKMKHLSRWMQKYHFPIIFGELERVSNFSACELRFSGIKMGLDERYNR